MLLAHPRVADAAVVGVPDETSGELPRAFVVAATDSGVEERGGGAAPPLDEAAVAAWVAERVAPHKRLRGGVAFVEQIPKSPSGKILRRVLLE